MEAKRGIDRIRDHAQNLECLAVLIAEASNDVHFDLAPDLLTSKARLLNSLTTDANHLLSEVHAEAARLEAISRIRTAADCD